MSAVERIHAPVGAALGGWLAMFLATSAFAGPSYSGLVTDNWEIYTRGEGGAAPVFVTFGQENAGFAWEGNAAAGPGILSLGVWTTIDGESGPSNSFGYRTGAAFVLDDLMITGPGSTVPVSINFDVIGSLMAIANVVSGPAYNFAEAWADVWMRVWLGTASSGGSLGGGGAQGEYSIYTSSRGDTSSTWNGLFVGFDGDDTMATGTFLAPVGQPLALTMEARVSVLLWPHVAPSSPFFGAPYYDPNYQPTILFVDARADFLNTIKFPSIGPVLTLPEGYTVNSVSGQISDNRWLGGSGEPVPEPATLALVAAGAACAAIRRRRR